MKKCDLAGNPPVCKRWRVSTRSRRGRDAVSTQKLWQFLKIWGRVRHFRADIAAWGSSTTGTGQRGGAPGAGTEKERGKERRRGLFSKSAAK